MQGSILPECPRLRPGVCAFPWRGTLVIRSAKAALRIPRHRSLLIQNLLTRLDGSSTLARLLEHERGLDGLFVLSLLSELSKAGMLADGPEPVCPPAPERRLLTGVNLTLLHDGHFARALEQSLANLGVKVATRVSDDVAGIVLACPDAPDFPALMAMNRMARSSGLTWLPVLPFGDAVISGPTFSGKNQPCFRCFELRWLGISPNVELERAYLAHVIRRPELQLASPKFARELASRALPALAARLLGEIPPGKITLTMADGNGWEEGLLNACPHCEVCGGTPAAGVPTCWDDEPLTLAELGVKVAALATSPCGLAAVLPRGDNRDADVNAPLQVAVCRFAFPEPDGVRGSQTNWTHGAAGRSSDAQALALVEAAERYCGLFPPPPGVWSSFEKLGSQALLPTELPLYAASEYARAQFPFDPFDARKKIRWNWGYNLTQQRPQLVPTSAVWYGYEDSLISESSSGVAAHSSRAMALLSGILELVERDAFMIHWLHRLSPPRLDKRDLTSPHHMRLLECITQSADEVHLLDLTTDLGLPVMLAVGVHRHGRRPALMLGAGAAVTISAALDKALGELYAATLSPTERWRPSPPLVDSDVIFLEDHARAYEHPDWLSKACFLWSSDRLSAGLQERSEPKASATALLKVRQRLEECGHEVIGVDMTTSDVAPYGLCVVRAIVPGLQPLALGNRWRLGGRRLFDAPQRMGIAVTAQRAEELNHTPHCFP